MRNRRTGGFANHIQLALQSILHDDIVAAPNEYLPNQWLFGTHGGRHGHVFVHRHIAPAQQHLSFGADGALQLLFTSQTRCTFFGEEHHADAVLTQRWQMHPLSRHVFAVKRIG